MFTIGEFSKLCGTSPRMLRHYNAIGLLCPQKVGHDNGYRYYTAEQIADVRKIDKLKSYGFSLTQVIQLLSLSPAEQLIMLQQQYQRVQEQAEQWKELACRMAYDLRKMEESEMKQEYQVRLEKFEGGRFFGRRRQAACNEHQIDQLVADAYSALEQQGGHPAGYAMMAFYGDGFDPEDADMEFFIPVREAAEGVCELPEALCAVTTHHGSFEHVCGAYDAIAEWLEAHPEYEMEALSYERFLVSPHTAATAEEIETEILFPVRKRG